MNAFLRKLHIYAQNWWFALTSWKKIKLAEDLGPCAHCKKPINPLRTYMYDWDGCVWHGRCAQWMLREELEFFRPVMKLAVPTEEDPRE